MKKILAFLSIAALAFATVACNPEDKEQGKLPSAAGIVPVVTVDGSVATFSLPAGTTGLVPIWYTNESGDFVFAGNGNNFQKTFFDAGTFKVRMYVSNSVGQSSDYSEASFTVEGQAGWNGYNYNSQYNIWKVGEDAGMDKSYTYYNPGWAAEKTLAFTINPYKLSLSDACGDRWQAQFHLVPGADVALSAEKHYDFSCIVKLNKPVGMTVKVVQQGDDNLFLFDQVEDTPAGENVFWMKDIAGVDAASIKVVFDFGYCEAGTEVEISRITLKDHANDDGTNAPDKEEKPEEADALDAACTIKADAATNLIDFTNLAKLAFHYAPGWTKIDDPTLTDITKHGFSVTYPVATDSRWMNQIALDLNVNLSADKTYDFSCTINSNNAFQYGVKLTNHDDNSEIFFHDCKWHTVLTAGQDCTFTIANLAGKDIPAKIFFDFGGNPENTTIVVKNVCLQEHID